jgi:hypothetical protein
MRDEKSLAHTRWNCKYHIVFAPKYQRQVFYGEKRKAIGNILRKLCEWKSVNILESVQVATIIWMGAAHTAPLHSEPEQKRARSRALNIPTLNLPSQTFQPAS